MATDRPKLREARHAAGLTQRELADRLGIPQPVVAVYETGRREPHVRAAVRLAVALGTTVEAIWEPARRPALATPGKEPAHNPHWGSGQFRLEEER